MSKPVDYTVRGIPAEDIERLDQIAEKNGRTRAAETRLALAVWAALGDEAREKLLAELRKIIFRAAPARPAPKRSSVQARADHAFSASGKCYCDDNHHHRARRLNCDCCAGVPLKPAPKRAKERK